MTHEKEMTVPSPLLKEIATHLGRSPEDMSGVESLVSLAVGFRLGALRVTILSELNGLEEGVKQNGGRGVDLAEEIDELRAILFLLKRANTDVVCPGILK